MRVVQGKGATCLVVLMVFAQPPTASQSVSVALCFRAVNCMTPKNRALLCLQHTGALSVHSTFCQRHKTCCCRMTPRPSRIREVVEAKLRSILQPQRINLDDYGTVYQRRIPIGHKKDMKWAAGFHCPSEKMSYILPGMTQHRQVS